MGMIATTYGTPPTEGIRAEGLASSKTTNPNAHSSRPYSRRQLLFCTSKAAVALLPPPPPLLILLLLFLLWLFLFLLLLVVGGCGACVAEETLVGVSCRG